EYLVHLNPEASVIGIDISSEALKVAQERCQRSGASEFDLIDESWLDFVGFSNPQFWQLERLLGDAPEVLERAKQLNKRDQYRLIESLDPEVTHYEFFLSKPPLPQCDWSDDSEFLRAIPERHPCMEGWESRNLFNADYELVSLSEEEFNLLQAIDQNAEKQYSLRKILQEVGGEISQARSLHQQKLITLTP
ncbi:MAG: methyltransferase domain-containing protein, partial [Chroococcales cyanobacterium]